MGEHGEKVVMQYFKDNNIRFEDKRHIKEFQQDEIDFISYAKNGKQTVEVKTSENNIHKYNSIMIKLHTAYDDEDEAIKRGNDAFICKTRASFLFFVDAQSNDIIIIKTDKIKECLNANLNTLRVVTYQDNEEDPSRSRYNRKNTVVYIPLTLFKDGIKRIVTNYKFKLNDSEFSSKRQ